MKARNWHEWLRLIQKAEHKAAVKAAGWTHIVYYGLVAWEAHGSYRYAAAVLLIIAIIHHDTPEG